MQRGQRGVGVALLRVRLRLGDGAGVRRVAILATQSRAGALVGRRQREHLLVQRGGLAHAARGLRGVGLRETLQHRVLAGMQCGQPGLGGVGRGDAGAAAQQRDDEGEDGGMGAHGG